MGHHSSRDVSRHIITGSVVIEQAFDLADCGNSNVFVPEPLVGEAHHILCRDGADLLLDFPWAQSPPRGDDLSADVFRYGRCAIKGKENRGLELGLCALDFGLGYGLREARPLTKREVDEIVDPCDGFGDQVDTPETVKLR